jgi:hypothetical protein
MRYSIVLSFIIHLPDYSKAIIDDLIAHGQTLEGSAMVLIKIRGLQTQGCNRPVISATLRLIKVSNRRFELQKSKVLIF